MLGCWIMFFLFSAGIIINAIFLTFINKHINDKSISVIFDSNTRVVIMDINRALYCRNLFFIV